MTMICAVSFVTLTAPQWAGAVPAETGQARLDHGVGSFLDALEGGREGV